MFDFEIRTESLMRARPARVWAALTQDPDWGRWNPFVTRVEGDLTPGSRLEVEIKPAPGKVSRFRPKVLVARPEQELRWRGRLWIPGLFSGEHYFRLEVREEGTLFTHGERFSGLLVPWVDPIRFLPGFHALNEGLRASVERRA